MYRTYTFRTRFPKFRLHTWYSDNIQILSVFLSLNQILHACFGDLLVTAAKPMLNIDFARRHAVKFYIKLLYRIVGLI
jgi:hypothetical protein